ncbi:uncharacterized protein EDB91DRAFT_1084789 [Suillus paluster]|uniref:uncharacterized protein n=1 Tax=Suillus paluster TaxID=48578 RepID=UPI001B8600EE|nr:uncharacterized protein EDB91DRAFT_1084789 [Suillus paluster]KAG1732460.1 hypothetical protein EDB91DRAFT_1084789 [Suillus paluster]
MGKHGNGKVENGEMGGGGREDGRMGEQENGRMGDRKAENRTETRENFLGRARVNSKTQTVRLKFTWDTGLHPAGRDMCRRHNGCGLVVSPRRPPPRQCMQTRVRSGPGPNQKRWNLGLVSPPDFR